MIMLSHCFYVWFSSDETFATAPMHPQHKNSENPTSDISSYSKITIVPIGRAKHARETPYNFCWLCQLLPKSFMMTNNENEWPLSWEYDDSFFIAQSLQAVYTRWAEICDIMEHILYTTAISLSSTNLFLYLVFTSQTEIRVLLSELQVRKQILSQRPFIKREKNINQKLYHSISQL